MKKNIFSFFLLTFMLISTFGLNAQNVNGVVSDNSGPLPGVNVIVKGTTRGAETDFNGKYTINDIKSNDVLIFSYVGYKTIEIAVNGRNTINVSLEEDSSTLEEVVVVGYGTKKKSLVTGAISSIDSKEIQSVSNQRVDQVLQGRASGVTVSASSGSPGAQTKIRIRGTGSSGNSSPLFIVDGMKVTTIDNIAPSDIANIEVLKDGASAAIYGTEGANGVVIVTTKKGRVGGPQFSFSSQLGMQYYFNKMELMNAEQFVTYLNEGGNATVVDNGINTDWIEETFDSAFMQRYDFSMSGATESTSYYFSVGHTDQDGIVGGDNSNFQRNSMRLNIKSDITEWLEAGANANAAFIKRRGIPENSDTRGVIQNMLIIDPLTPVTYEPGNVPASVTQRSADNGVPVLRDSNGNVYGYPTYSTGEVLNPVAFANDIQQNISSTSQFLSTLYLKAKIIEGLNFTTRYGVEQNLFLNKTTTNAYYVTSEASNTQYNLSEQKVRFSRWLWENFASYEKSFENHNFKLLAGFSAEQSRRPTFTTRRFSAPVDQFRGFNSNSSAFTFDPASPINRAFRDNLVSMYGRLSYDYDEKYLFEATVRSDKSDKFTDNNKSAVFPSFSAGWVVSKEDFWADDFLVNTLKVRASWGQNGNKNGLPVGTGITAITTEDNGATLSYLGNIGAQITTFGNPDLVWETSEQLGFGVDASAFENRLNVSADYYQKTTRDLIVGDGSLITPGSAGFPFAPFNAGTVVNKGFEIEIGYSDTTSGDFSYQINANLSTLDNEVTEIKFLPQGAGLIGAGAPQNDDGVTRFSEGFPAWYFYGFKTDGIDPATGQVIKVDTNEDGIINNADKTFIGSPHPDILFGGNIKLGYKSFDFNIQFQGTIGNEIFATYHQPSRQITNKPIQFFEGRWTGPGDTDARFPAPGTPVLDSYDTDLVVEDGSFMRIKQIQLGYTLPESFTNKLRMNRVRLYVSLDDFFTFTGYNGLDPEVGNFSFNDTGVDRGFYPTAARALFGFSVNF
ncbi:SusC/RagA family TonB-linked outer membrane protein [Tenacibaculum jejuense]|uniref:SusC-like TonB-dependent outer membrane receptor n=1 Tax=Tenacibaculum jejuense TaxID=584609 RepID=A0A238UD59_9FLAO|nr:TonB-dependent receptor [Tenacibaculum jejuense]SNR16518.1 SusC-like TonB-dependent outer membrane receptor precursor [Tenacibaculum jejuense]